MEKVRILIVEDEAIIAMELESQLQSLGYEITSIVDTGEKAIKKAEADKPDLILMDIRIKGEMDGIEAAEAIRSRFGIPVIFSTAYLDEDRIERAKITMPFGYVLKPIQERDLRVTLEMALYVAKVNKERIKTEETLQESNVLLQTAMDQSQAGIAIADAPDGKLRYVNDAGLGIRGRSKEEIVNGVGVEQYVESWQILHLDGTPYKSDEVPLARAVIYGETNSREFIIRRPDDEDRIVLANAAPILNNQGKITAGMVVFLDITEHYQVKTSLNKIEWLLKKSTEQSDEGISYSPFYGDVTELNTSQVIKGAIDAEILNSIASDTIDLLETSVAIYEKNGDYAFGMFSSGWCQLMDSASRKLCDTDDNREALKCGKWLCHENCWNESAKTCIESGKPTDIECIGGIHLYAEPIIANQEVIGVINIGYGNPPIDEETLKELSDQFNIPINDLTKSAEEYDSRPFYIIELAKKRLKTSAMLIGKMVESAILQKKVQS